MPRTHTLRKDSLFIIIRPLVGGSSESTFQHVEFAVSADIVPARVQRMRKEIAIAVVACQLLAAMCEFQGAVSRRNACCRGANMPCSSGPSSCCRIGAAELPSLAAAAPYKVAPVRWVVSRLEQAGAQGRSVRARAALLQHPLSNGSSPPPIYLLNSILLI